MQKLQIIITVLNLFCIINVFASGPYNIEENNLNNSNINSFIFDCRKGGLPNSLETQVSAVFECLKKNHNLNNYEQVKLELENFSQENVEQAIIILSMYKYYNYVNSGVGLEQLKILLTKGMEKEVPDIKYIVARMNLNGEVFKKDNIKGFKLMLDAANSGSIVAQSALSIIYETGSYDIDMDKEKSLYWDARAKETAKNDGWPSFTPSNR